MSRVKSGASTVGQRGVVLIVVLVMLAIFMVIAVSLVNTSNVNFRIVGNQQNRMEAKLAARNAQESFISNPANFQIPLPTSDTLIGTDLDGDTIDEYTARVAPPRCIRAVPIKLNELNFENPDDAPCFGSGAVDSGLLTDSGGSGSGNSWCTSMGWDVQASVNDQISGAQVQMHQGVELRALIGTPCP